MGGGGGGRAVRSTRTQCPFRPPCRLRCKRSTTEYYVALFVVSSN